MKPKNIEDVVEFFIDQDNSRLCLGSLAQQ